MGYPKHWLLQFGGDFGSFNPEIWSCGIRLASSPSLPGDSFPTLDVWLASTAKDALAAWFGRATSKISSNCRLEFVKCNEIGPDGLFADKSQTHEYFWPSPPVGGGGASTMAMQLSVVLSWETAAASRGLASKGRIYSPAPATTVSSSGTFPPADALGMAQSAATLLSALKVVIPAGFLKPSIVSQGKFTPPDTYGPGVSNQITQVRVDNRLDIQRRRANAIQAASSIAVLA